MEVAKFLISDEVNEVSEIYVQENFINLLSGFRLVQKEVSRFAATVKSIQDDRRRVDSNDESDNEMD